MKEGWEYKKLGDLCQVLDSQRKPVTKKDRTKGIYPYYGATGIQDYVDSYIFDGRFLLVGEDGAKWGAFDKTAYIIEGKSWVNNHAHILKVLENVNDRLLDYYLTFKDLSEYITGAVVPKLTQKALVSIPIPIPPLSEQQHIVEELDLLSSIIEKKKAQLNELDNLAQSLFYEMFGDPITNEKGWDVKTWKDVFETKTGKLNANASTEGGKYPFFTCSKETSYIDTYAFDCEALLLAGNNASAIYDVKYYKGKFNAYQRTYILTIKEGVYPFYKISLEGKLSFLQSHSLGGLTKYLTMGVLNGLSFIAPPISLQQQFASKIEVIEHQKELIKQSIKEVETLFNSRMDYYFN